MANIGIITGSNNNLPESLIKNNDITVIPYPITWGEETFLDGKKYTSLEFLARLKSEKITPRTSAISIGQFTDIFRKLSKDGNSIIGIFMSSGLTKATYESLRKAKDIEKNICVDIIDTSLVMGGVGLVALEAAKAVKSGKSKEEVLKIANETKEKTFFIGALQDLNYLYRQGRIGKAKSLLGSFFKIIPIIGIDKKEGIVIPLGKGKNYKDVNRRIIELMRLDIKKFNGRMIRCITSNAGDNNEAQEDLNKQIRKNFECEEIINGQISFAQIIYIGPESWGIGYTVI